MTETAHRDTLDAQTVYDIGAEGYVFLYPLVLAPDHARFPTACEVRRRRASRKGAR